MLFRPYSRSFAGGEITPELFGRADLVKFQTGLQKCLNFWVLAHGPVQNRPGFAYVNEAKDSSKVTRLIPFSYNTQQTFAIEFGAGYIRWHTNGATLLETAKATTGITIASPGVWNVAAHGYSVGDWLYVSGVTGTLANLVSGRYLKVGTVPDADRFTLTDLAGAAINTTGYTVTAAGSVARVYEIATTYAEADLMGLHFTQSNDVLTITHLGYPPRELKRLGATSWTISDIGFSPSIATPAAPSVVASPASGATNNSYKTTALATDTLEESLPSAATAVANDLAIAGNINIVTPAAVVGAVRYNVYKLLNGLYGYIGQTDGAALRDNNIIPNVSKTPAEASTPFAAASDYPAGVGYYEGRRVFGGTTNKPQNYWLTRSGTESNLSYSIPTRDDDTIQGKIKANEVNAILHVVSTNEQLVLLTSGGVWKLSPQNSDILTPTSALPKQLSTEGAANVQPVKTADDVIYVNEAGSRLYTVRYRWESNGLVSDDLSLMAPHLFDGYTLADVAYSKGQMKMVWSVRSDGKLIGNTYVPRHEVNAVHQHDTDGLFESVCSVKEGTEYPVYALIKRTLNGRAVRYIERMHTRRFSAISACFFVDCGLTYSGSAATVIGGLWHLIGKTVSILADGAEVGQQVVAADGTITLGVAASTVHVGLPITADVQGLPLVLEAMAAAGQANLKNISEVYLRVTESGGIKAGPDFTKLRELPARSNENYDTPPALKNGVVHLAIDNRWGIDSAVCIRQTAPLPLTISSMALMVAAGG